MDPDQIRDALADVGQRIGHAKEERRQALLDLEPLAAAAARAHLDMREVATLAKVSPPTVYAALRRAGIERPKLGPAR